MKFKMIADSGFSQFKWFISLEIAHLVLFLSLLSAGGFLVEQGIYLAFVLTPVKVGYYTLIWRMLMSGAKSSQNNWPVHFRWALNVHAVTMLTLLIFGGIGGVLRFDLFLFLNVLIEIFFAVYIGLSVQELLEPSTGSQFFNEGGSDLSMPEEGADLREQVLFFLKNGRTSKALSLLESHFSGTNDSESHRIVIIRLGELSALETEIKRGNITVGEARSQLSSIRNICLDLANSISGPASF